mmetsp:Transcript_84665/g.274265  ORF Transcript_84665/g.274265 Transcript_84665/m.274265 type:complete len:366 (-) Transcript_84665:422-1519(-)
MHQAVEPRVVEDQLAALAADLSELLERAPAGRGRGRGPARVEALDGLVLHGPPLPLRELVPPVLEALADLQRDLPADVLVEGDALHQAVVLRVGRVLLDLALVVEDGLLALVAARVEGLAGDVGPLAPGGRHVQDLRRLLRLAGLGLLGCGARALLREEPGARLRAAGLGVQHHVLEVPRVVELQLHLRGAADLHVHPEVPMVPDEVDLEVGAPRHVVDAARRGLDVHVLRHLPGALAHEDPAMDAPVLELVLVAGGVVLGVRLHLLLLHALLVRQLRLLPGLFVLGLQGRLLLDHKVLVLWLHLVLGVFLVPLKLRAGAPGLVARGDEPGRKAADAVGVITHANEQGAYSYGEVKTVTRLPLQD